MLSTIRFVLVHTSHPGNIGSAARAMKNMGLSRLYLVAPKQFPHGQATALASGADDLLSDAKVVETLPEALVGCEFVFGTSARSRTLAWPTSSPRLACEQIKDNLKSEIAIVFGSEQAGLTNEQLACCQHHIHVPTVEDFSSLNLAAAVQLMAYELRMATFQEPESDHEAPRDLATSDQLNCFFEHLREVMLNVGFLNPKQPKMLMQRLQRLFYRASLDKTELNILMGFLTAILQRGEKR